MNIEIFCYYNLSKDKLNVYKNYVIVVEGSLFNVTFPLKKSFNFNDNITLDKIPTCDYYSIVSYARGKVAFPEPQTYKEYCEKVNFVKVA